MKKSISVERDRRRIKRFIANSGDFEEWLKRCVITYSNEAMLIICPDFLVARYLFCKHATLAKFIASYLKEIKTVHMVLDGKLYRCFETKIWMF